MPFLTSPHPSCDSHNFWPSRILISDAARLPDWSSALARLPRASGLILRDYQHPKRAAMAEDMAKQCKAQGHVFFIAGDAALARRMGARLHAPEYMTGKPAPRMASAAAHGEAAILRAAKNGFASVLISPVFQTRSHIGAPILGPVRLHALARLAKRQGLIAYALGGMNERNWPRLGAAQHLLQGYAAIDGFAD